MPVTSSFDVDAERNKLRAEFEEAMNELKNQYERVRRETYHSHSSVDSLQEQTTKAGLQADLISLKEQYERVSSHFHYYSSFHS